MNIPPIVYKVLVLIQRELVVLHQFQKQLNEKLISQTRDVKPEAKFEEVFDRCQLLESSIAQIEISTSKWAEWQCEMNELKRNVEKVSNVTYQNSLDNAKLSDSSTQCAENLDRLHQRVSELELVQIQTEKSKDASQLEYFPILREVNELRRAWDSDHAAMKEAISHCCTVQQLNDRFAIAGGTFLDLLSQKVDWNDFKLATEEGAKRSKP